MPSFSLVAPQSQALALAVKGAMDRLGLRVAERADGWESHLMGIGSTDDKLATLRYSGHVTHLPDVVLEAMFLSEIYAYRGVTIFPHVAFSQGVEVAGVEDPKEATTFLESFDWTATITSGAVWGRLYGGCATWFVTDRSADELLEPLDVSETIVTLRNIEKPYINPVVDSRALDLRGMPLFYTLTTPEGETFRVHASRLVIWPGDETPQRRRVQLGHWDASVLQRPYDVLKRNGYVSIAAQQLLSEASLGVLKIRELWATITSGQQTSLATRIRMFNAARSNARALILDADKEEFTRVNTTFAGVPELTDRARLEVAAAFGIPVTRLMGQSPAGLNATGQADERNFQSDVRSYQKFKLEPRILVVARKLLDSRGSPCSSEGLALGWPELWAPTAAEAATIYSTTANADATLIDREVITPEEARSRFKPGEYSAELDVEATDDADGDGDVDLNDADGEPGTVPITPEGAPEGAATPVAPAGESAPAGAGVAPIQATVLNGAQVSSLVEIISQVSEKKIPRDSGVEIVMLAYQVDRERAEALIGSAGKGFEPTKDEPPAFGGGGGFGKPGAQVGKPPTGTDKSEPEPLNASPEKP